MTPTLKEREVLIGQAFMEKRMCRELRPRIIAKFWRGLKLNNRYPQI